MTDFQRALELVLRAEGGYVNDPVDPGGETNFGVTRAVWEAWCASRREPVKPMRELAPADVSPLYEDRYWRAARCHEMPWPLAAIHFDAAVNNGVGQAAKLLQRALGVVADGRLGPLTMARTAPAGPRECYRYLLERTWFYRHLARDKPTLGKFLGGWLARLEHLYPEIT